MNNYFYNLPTDLQSKIYEEVHKLNMEEIRKRLLYQVIIRLIKKNSYWLDYQAIGKEFWDLNNELI